MTNKNNKAFDIVKNNDLYSTTIKSVKDLRQRDLIEEQVRNYTSFLQKLMLEIENKKDENK